MIVELVQKYDTDISFLFSRKREDTVFISDWENSTENLFLSEKTLAEIASNHALCNKYIYSRDLCDLKETICSYINEAEGIKVSSKNIMITSNATISGMLVSKFLKRKGVKRVLIIGPIYFTYIHVFYDDGIVPYNLKFDMFKPFELQEEEFKKIIEENSIDACLIISPLYRTGVELTDQRLEMICRIMESRRGYIIIDEAYGNFSWEKGKSTLCNIALINRIIKYPHAVMFDSIAKRVFANGMKSSIIYARDENIIKEIEKDSVIWAGSLSYIQVNFLQYVFNEGKEQILDIMNQSSEVVRNLSLIHI